MTLYRRRSMPVRLTDEQIDNRILVWSAVFMAAFVFFIFALPAVFAAYLQFMDAHFGRNRYGLLLLLAFYWALWSIARPKSND